MDYSSLPRTVFTKGKFDLINIPEGHSSKFTDYPVDSYNKMLVEEVMTLNKTKKTSYFHDNPVNPLLLYTKRSTTRVIVTLDNTNSPLAETPKPPYASYRSRCNNYAIIYY